MDSSFCFSCVDDDDVDDDEIFNKTPRLSLSLKMK